MASPGPEGMRIERIMGCTRDEYTRWVRHFEDRADLFEAVDEAEVDGGRIHIRIAVLAPRRIALLALPQLDVRYHWDAPADAAARTWLARFDLYSQRGGG